MRSFCVLIVLAVFATFPALAQKAAKAPSADEVKTMLEREPIDEASWPVWQPRLAAWMGEKGHGPDQAFKDAEAFLLNRAGASAILPPRYDKDHIAWYLLGIACLYQHPPSMENPRRAEKALRRSLEIAPKFARPYRHLALALAAQAPATKTGLPSSNDPRFGEADQALLDSLRIDPDLPVVGYQGYIELQRGQLAAAKRDFEKAMRLEPESSDWVIGLAKCTLRDANDPHPVKTIKPLLDRYPADGGLASCNAVALAIEKRLPEAAAELERARSLGADPSVIVGADFVNQLEAKTKPGLTDQFLGVMMWFAIVYGCIMLVMAIAGVILANMTRGTGALDLLRQQDPAHLVQSGHIARGSGESLLARLYGFALMVGLILFYLAIPFIVAGLLGATALLLYLIFQAPSVPLRLVILVFVVGGLSAWAVFKSIFTRPATGGFGLIKTREQCPALHQLLAEVAQKVDTDPVNEVFLAPGASIGVHQEGRGPFGMFGVNKRVLTLGFCTLRFLTVGELKAILAHEYAHFSHSDTFYSRFIYQVHTSIEEALYGMTSAGGVITYINPFYWFLWLYYKSYSLLAAGYSRSREFLADRMAATLYGSAQFKTALEKVSTDGALFEVTIYEHISTLLREQKAFVNMYEAFAKMREEGIPVEERNKFYQDLLDEKGSLFASHPTFAERVEAIQSLPAATEPDNRSALELFEQPGAIEEELTKFLTDYMAYLAHLQSQAAQQS